MSKSIFAQGWTIVVAVVLLAVAVFEPVGGQPASSADPGTIAYVRRSTHDIHLISPDGDGDRVLWTAPDTVGVWPAYDFLLSSGTASQTGQDKTEASPDQVEDE